ncbi:MAG: DUF3618 domain-containing protein [Actinobacteria bacterium]|nr:DUF3618 domain-containing protein [Actinomycetota bacterium]
MSEQPTTAPRFSSPRTVELEAQIAATRAELAATVDQLTSRLDPKVQATRIVHEATAPDVDPQARKRARIVLGVAGAAAVLLVAGLIRSIVK